VIALLPIRAESIANRREHWTTRARRAQQHRDTAKWHCIASSTTRPTLPCVITLTRIAPRALDAHDNLPISLKNTVDGIADYLGIDDRDPRVRWEYAQRRGEPKQYAVEVAFTQEKA